MSVVVAKDNEYHELVCKGALEEMLAICSHVRHEDEVIPLSEALLVRIRRITDDLKPAGAAGGGGGQQDPAGANPRIRRGGRVGSDPRRLRRLPRSAEGRAPRRRWRR